MMPHSERVKAIYRNGTLQLLEPVSLSEGVEVWVELHAVRQSEKETSPPSAQAVQGGPAYPTRPQPPETLARLIGIIAVGGDAFEESEAVYDADWH